jgi:hypothetical protein
MWTLRKGSLTASCVVRPHQTGQEVVVTMGGVALYTQSHPDVARAIAECVAMQRRMTARGWVDHLWSTSAGA